MQKRKNLDEEPLAFNALAAFLKRPQSETQIGAIHGTKGNRFFR